MRTGQNFYSAAEEIVRYHYAVARQPTENVTIAVEKRFELDLGGGFSFIGVIDRLALSPAGVPVVIDYKTSVATKNPPRNIPDLLQL